MTNRRRMRALVTVVGLVLGAAVVAAFVLLRTMQADARLKAARMLGCAVDEVEVEAMRLGDIEHWRVEACGVHGTLVCEPTDAGCFIVPDEP